MARCATAYHGAMRNQALIVVDVQAGFDDPAWGERNNPACEQNVAALTDRWEQLGWPVVIVRHDSVEPQSPLRPELPGNRLKDFLAGRGDLLVTKSVHSAFHGRPDLHGWLTDRGIDAVAVCGITTNHCCETTARVACDLGYQVCFVGDATATFDRTAPSGQLISADQLVEATLTNLTDEFAEVSDTYRLLQRVTAPAD